jgi:hypothetical protein
MASVLAMGLGLVAPVLAMGLGLVGVGALVALVLPMGLALVEASVYQKEGEGCN